MKKSFFITLLLLLSFKVFSSENCVECENKEKSSKSSLESTRESIGEVISSYSENLEKHEQYKLQLSYLQQDLCFATHVPTGCKLNGLELKVTIPLNKIYAFASVANLESIDGETEEGKPNFESMPLEVGLGLSYIHNKSLKSIYELGYNMQGDKENYWDGGNSNYNEGFRFKAKVEKDFTQDLTVGVGLVHDRSQNSSHIAHHGFKDKKPKMSFTNGELYATYKLTKNLSIRAKVIKILQKPSDSMSSTSSSNGDYQQNEPDLNYALEVEYVFDK